MDSVTMGYPLADMVKVPATPTVNAVAFALVIAGGWFTVSVKLWVASGAIPLLAVMVNG